MPTIARRRPRAFTLVEIVIVVLIMGLVVVTGMRISAGLAEDAEIAAIQRSLVVIQEQVDVYHARRGAYPSTIDPAWFRGGKLPRHPQNDGSIPDLHVLTVDDREHPQYKILDLYGAYWYNPNVGIVRARVPNQGSDAATLDYYNRVNRSALTSMNQKYTIPPAPGGASPVEP
ncbi:MAG: type II secretion system protein [Planctomycetota bacterium]